MKFGGTSVADLERIRRVGRLVAAEAQGGRPIAVVVSAMAGKTNELVAWTDGSGPAAEGLTPSDDEYDVVVASGEQVTAGLLAMTLRNMGRKARSWMGWQIPIIADDYVDPAFGSGCVKITPAHDFNDYEIGRRHGLAVINVLSADGVVICGGGGRPLILLAVPLLWREFFCSLGEGVQSASDPRPALGSMDLLQIA